MADNTNIEWADSTFSPWTGCTKVSPGCEHCYAEGWSKRAGEKVGKWGPGAPRVRTTSANWRMPVKWNARGFYECANCGSRNDGEHAVDRQGAETWVCQSCKSERIRSTRRRVFCASLADVFDNEVPAEWLADLLALINATPNLDWLLLTKRIGNFWNRVHAAGVVLHQRNDVGGGSAGDMAEAWIQLQPPENVWLGATVVNQEEADRDIPKLLATPAAVRFLSIEPMLGSITLRQSHVWECCGHPLRVEKGVEGVAVPGCFYECCQDPDNVIDWIIVDGESGPHARPMHPAWARSLRDQCVAAGVPFFMKQMGGARDKRGALKDLPDDLRIRELPHANP